MLGISTPLNNFLETENYLEDRQFSFVVKWSPEKARLGMLKRQYVSTDDAFNIR